MFKLAAITAITACLGSASAATYHLSDNFVGSGFLSGFTHEAIPDPTHGRVTYVDQSTALAQNLTFASGNSFIMRADSKSVLTASGPGRNSVRIKSIKTYTTHVAVFDIRHMPQGCSTWPAAWEVMEDGWPNGGEIDILEGVNDISPNQATLHTTSGCTMPASVAQTGTTVSTNCDTNVNGNQGCGVHMPTTNSYGPSFNANGGGIYAMERTTSFVKVWFWPRGSAIPSDVGSGAAAVNTDAWGTPSALFPNTQCNLASKLAAHNIIINLTLCGDWAGAVFNADGCPGDCATYVNNNPAAFANAYWDIAAVRTYSP